MYCSRDAYTPELLDRKNIQLRRLHAQAGSTSRKSISRQSLKPYFDYDFSHAQSSRIAHDFERYIKATRKHTRETPQFVEGILNKILYLHNYNLKVAEVTFKYPLTKSFEQLLLHYIALQCNVLYRRDYYTPINEVTIEKKVLRLLLNIYNSCFEYLMTIPPKKIFEESAKAIVKLLIQIKLEFDIKNELIENILKKLLNKLGKLENVTALEDKCIPCPLDTYLHDPAIIDTCKNIITSDYGTDDDLKIDDGCIQIEDGEENSDNDDISVDIKPEVDYLFRVSTGLVPNQDKSSKVPTIYIGDDDDLMVCLEEEVKTSNKSSNREKEKKEKQLALKEKQNQAFTNHKPITLDGLSEIKTDLKEEVNDITLSPEDEVLAPKSTDYSDNLSSENVNTGRKCSFVSDVVVIDDDCDELSEPVLNIDNKLGQDTVGSKPELPPTQLVSNTSSVLPQTIALVGNPELTAASEPLKETQCFLSESKDDGISGENINTRQNIDEKYETNGKLKISSETEEISQPVLPIDGKLTKDIVCSNPNLLVNDKQHISNASSCFPRMTASVVEQSKSMTAKETDCFLSEAVDDSTHEKIANTKENIDENCYKTKGELKIPTDITSPIPIENNLTEISLRSELSEEDIELNEFESYYVVEARKARMSITYGLQIQTVQVQDKVEPTLQTSNNNQRPQHQNINNENSLPKNSTAETDVEIDKIKISLNITNDVVEEHNKNIEFTEMNFIEEIESNRDDDVELIQKRPEVHIDTKLGKASDNVTLEIDQNVAVDEMQISEEISEGTESSESKELENESTTQLENTLKVVTNDDNSTHQVTNSNAKQETVANTNLQTLLDKELIENMEKLFEANEPLKEISTMEQLVEKPVVNAKLIEASNEEHNSDSRSNEVVENVQKPVENVNIETMETPITNMVEGKLIPMETPCEETTDPEVNNEAQAPTDKEANFKGIKCNETNQEGIDSVQGTFPSVELLENKLATNSEELITNIEDFKKPTNGVEGIQTSANTETEESVEASICIQEFEQLRAILKPHNEMESVTEKISTRSSASKIEDKEKCIEENNETVNDKDIELEKQRDANNTDLYKESISEDDTTISSIDICEDLNVQVKPADKPTLENMSKPIEQNSATDSVGNSQFQEVIDSIQLEENNEVVEEKSTTALENCKEYVQEMEIIYPKTLEEPMVQDAASVIEESIVEGEVVIELDNEKIVTENSDDNTESIGSIKERENLSIGEENKKETEVPMTNGKKDFIEILTISTLEMSEEVILCQEEPLEQNITKEMNKFIGDKTNDKSNQDDCTESGIVDTFSPEATLTVILCQEEPLEQNNTKEINRFIGDKINDKSNLDDCSGSGIVDKSSQEATLTKKVETAEKIAVKVDISQETAILTDGEAICNEINNVNAMEKRDVEESISTGITEKPIQKNIVVDTDNNIAEKRDIEEIIEEDNEDIPEKSVQDSTENVSADQPLETMILNENVRISGENIEKVDSQQGFEILKNEEIYETSNKDSEAFATEIKETSFDTFEKLVDDISLNQGKTGEFAKSSESLSRNTADKSVDKNTASLTEAAIVEETFIELEENVIEITDNSVQDNSTENVIGDRPEVKIRESDVLNNGKVYYKETVGHKITEDEKKSSDTFKEAGKVNLNEEKCAEIVEVQTISNERGICKDSEDPLENDDTSKNLSELNIVESFNQKELICDNRDPDICTVASRSSTNYEDIEDEPLNDNKPKAVDFTGHEEFQDGLKEAEFVDELNIHEEIITVTDILESSVSEQFIADVAVNEDTPKFNNHGEISVSYIPNSDEPNSNQIVPQNDPAELLLDASHSILEKMKDALKKIGTEIIAANDDKKVEPEKIVQDLEICAIPSEKTSLDILATVASKVPRQDLSASKSNKKGAKRGRKKQSIFKSKRTVRKCKKSVKVETNYEQKCKPHDFVIVSNSEISPPANNIYTQKLPDISITSEDSNDSEGNLLIDEDVDIKTNKHPNVIEETVIEDSMIETAKLNPYDEDTFEEEITFACEPRVKGTVLISIPDNYQANFDILKQIEEVELCSTNNLNNINHEESTRKDNKNISYDTNPIKEDPSSTGETIDQTNSEKLKASLSLNKVVNADIHKDIDSPTLEKPPSANRNAAIRNYKPFRTKAERKDYDKFKLNPYVSIERLNVCCKVKEEEEKCIRTRSKSFDISMIRNSERTPDARRQQRVYLKEENAAIAPNDDPDQKICVEQNDFTEVSESSVEVKSTFSQDMVKSSTRHFNDNDLSLADLNPNSETKCPMEEQIQDSTLDDIPLLLRKPTKIKGRRKRMYGSKSSKQKKGKIIRQKVEKHQTENEIVNKSVKRKKNKSDTLEASDSNVMTRLRRKTTLDNPEELHCSNTTSDDKIPETDCKTRTKSDSKNVTSVMAIDVTNLGKKDNPVSKIEVELKQTNLNKCEDELTFLNKTPRKPERDVNTNENIAGNSNRKYYTTPKLRRKSISKDNLNRIERNAADVSEDNLNKGAANDNKLPLISDRKYYRAPKFRTKAAVKGEAILPNDTPKKPTLKQLKPSTYKVDILSKSKNPVSPTIEKLKKKLEIDFKLNCDEIIYDKLNNMERLSENCTDSSVLVQGTDKVCADELKGKNIISKDKSKQDHGRNKTKSPAEIKDEITIAATNQNNKTNNDNPIATSNDGKVYEENIQYDLIHFDINDQNVINEEVVEHAEVLYEQPLKITLKTDLVYPKIDPKKKEIEANEVKANEQISDVIELENILSEEVCREMDKSKEIMDNSEKSTVICETTPANVEQPVHNQELEVVSEERDSENIPSKVDIKSKGRGRAKSLTLNTTIGKEIKVEKSIKQIENNENLNSLKVANEIISHKLSEPEVQQPLEFDQICQTTPDADLSSTNEIKESLSQGEDSLDNIPLLERALKLVKLTDVINKQKKKVKVGSSKKDRKRSVSTDMESKQKDEKTHEADTNVENKIHKGNAVHGKLLLENVENKEKIDKFVSNTEVPSQHFKSKKTGKQNLPIASTPNKKKVNDINNSDNKVQNCDAKFSKGIEGTVAGNKNEIEELHHFEHKKVEKTKSHSNGRKRKKHVSPNKKSVKDKNSKDIIEDKESLEVCRKIEETNEPHTDKSQTPLIQTQSTCNSSTNDYQNINTTESHPISTSIMSLVKIDPPLPSSRSPNSKAVNDISKKEHRSKLYEKSDSHKYKTHTKSKSSSNSLSLTPSKDNRYIHKEEKESSRKHYHKSNSRSSSVSSHSSSKSATPNSELSDKYEKDKHSKSKYRSSSVSSSSRSSRRATPDILEKKRREHCDREKSKSKHHRSKSRKSLPQVSQSSVVNTTSTSSRSTKKNSDDTKLVDLRPNNISEKLDTSSKKTETKVNVDNIDISGTRNKASKEEKKIKNEKGQRKKRGSSTDTKQDVSPTKRRKIKDSDKLPENAVTGDSKISSDRTTSEPKIKQLELSEAKENLSTQCTSDKLMSSNQTNENEDILKADHITLKKEVIKLKVVLEKAKDSQDVAIIVEPLLSKEIQDEESVNVEIVGDANVQQSPELDKNSNAIKEEEIAKGKTDSVKHVEADNENVPKCTQNFETEENETSQGNLISQPDEVSSKISVGKPSEKSERNNSNSKLLDAEDINETNAAESPKFNQCLEALKTNDLSQVKNVNLNDNYFKKIYQPACLKEIVKEFLRSMSLNVNEKTVTLRQNSGEILNPQVTQINDIQKDLESKYPEAITEDFTSTKALNTNKLNVINSEQQTSEEIDNIKITQVNTSVESLEEKGLEELATDFTHSESLKDVNEKDPILKQNLEDTKNMKIVEENSSCDNLVNVLQVPSSEEVRKAPTKSASSNGEKLDNENVESCSIVDKDSEKIEENKIMRVNIIRLNDDDLGKKSELNSVNGLTTSESVNVQVSESSAEQASKSNKNSEEIEKNKVVQTNSICVNDDNLSTEVKCLEDVADNSTNSKSLDVEVNKINAEEASKLKQSSEEIQICQIPIEVIKDSEKTNSQLDQSPEAIENEEFVNSVGVINDKLSEVSQVECSQETSERLTNVGLLQAEELDEIKAGKHLPDLHEENIETITSHTISQANKFNVSEDIPGKVIETEDINKAVIVGAAKLENNENKIENLSANMTNETAQLQNEELMNQKLESQEIKQIHNSDTKQNKDVLVVAQTEPKCEYKVAKSIPEKTILQSQGETTREDTSLAIVETSDLGNDKITTKEDEMSSSNVVESTNSNENELEHALIDGNTLVETTKLKNEKLMEQNEVSQDIIKQIPDHDVQQTKEGSCIAEKSSKPKCENKTEKNMPVEAIEQSVEVTGPVREEIADIGSDTVRTQMKQPQEVRERPDPNVTEKKESKNEIAVPLLNYTDTPKSNPDVKRKKVHGRDVKLKNIEDAFEQYLPTKPKENAGIEEETDKGDVITEVQDLPSCAVTTVSESSDQLTNKKRKSIVLDLEHGSVTKTTILASDVSNKKVRLEEVNKDAPCETLLNNNKPSVQISPLCISPKKKDRKSIEVIISHLKEEKSGNSVSSEENMKNEVTSPSADGVNVNKLRSKLLEKIKYPDQGPTLPVKDVQQNERNNSKECFKDVSENIKTTMVAPSGSAFKISHSENDKTHIDVHGSPKNILDTPRESEPKVEVGGGSINYLSKKFNTVTGTTRVEYNIEIGNNLEASVPENNSEILVPITADRSIKTPKEINPNEVSFSTAEPNAFINDSLPGKHDIRCLEKEKIIENSLNDVIESSFIDNSMHIPPMENNVIESLDSSGNRESPNLLNLSDLIMDVDSTPTNVTNMEEITVSPDAVCMFPSIISTTISSPKNKLPCSSSPDTMKLFTFPVASEADIKEEFIPLDEVSKSSNFLDDANTSTGKVGSLHESCVFSFREQIDNSSARTLSSPGLDLNLQDVPFSNIPMGSTQSFDLISSKSLSMVQTSRNNNFTNDVPVGNEISDIMTEIIYSNEPDDHNYTLGPVGGPLVSGRLEQENKNISPTTFNKTENKSLDDSPNEYSLNNAQLQEFEFSDDTYKLNLDNEYAVKNLVILGSQTSTDTNAFPLTLTNYNVADIKRINLIDDNISNSEENTNSKEYLDSIISPIKQETQNMSNNSNPWAEFIANENPNQKVVVLPNEQCITIAENELIESIGNRVVGGGGKTVKDDKAIGAVLPISPSVSATCSSQKASEPPKVMPNVSINRPTLGRNRKNVSFEPAQKDNALNDFISKRRYSRTLLRPKKKNPPVSSVKESKKEATVTTITTDVGTSNAILSEATPQIKSFVETNVTAIPTEKSTLEDGACLLQLNKSIQANPERILKGSNDTGIKVKPMVDLIVPPFENKRKSPSQSHLSPRRDILDKQIIKSKQNQAVPCLTKDLSEKGNLQQKSSEKKKSPWRSPREDLLQPTLPKVTESLDITKASGIVQKSVLVPSIAEQVKSRKRLATNKYSNSYLPPPVSATRESNIKTTETVKLTKSTLLDKPHLENGVFHNVVNEARSKIDSFQTVQESKKAVSQSHPQIHKSPVRGTLANSTKPFAELDGKGKPLCQTRSDTQKNMQDTLNTTSDNLTKSIDHLMKYDLLPKKPIIPPTIPAEPPKSTTSKYNYSIDSILSKSPKSFVNNYKCENPVKDYRQPKNQGIKRNLPTVEDEVGKVDNKKQRKLDSNGTYQTSSSRDTTFDELLQQGNVNRLISLRVTEDNKLKPERRSSPLLTERKNSPLSTERKNSPLSTERKNSPLATERKNSPLSMEKKNSPLSIERKNSPLSTGRKNSPLLKSHNKEQNQREEIKSKPETRSSPLATNSYSSTNEQNEGINLRLEKNSPLATSSYNKSKEQNQKDSNHSRSSIHPVYDRSGGIRRDKSELQEKRPESRRSHHPYQQPYPINRTSGRESFTDAHRVQDGYNSDRIPNRGRETRHSGYYRGREGHQSDYSRGREGLRSDHSRGREGLLSDHRGKGLVSEGRERNQQSERSRRTEGHQSDHRRGRGGTQFDYPSTSGQSPDISQSPVINTSNVSGLFYTTNIDEINKHPNPAALAAYNATGPYTKRNRKITPEEKKALIQSCQVRILDSLRPPEDKDESEYSWIDKFTERLESDSYLFATSASTPQFFPKPSP